MSTALVPEREQFAYWRDGFRGAMFGLRSEPLSTIDGGFRAEADVWTAPSLGRFRCSAENLMVFRGPREIARRQWNSIWVYQQRGPGACYEQNGREFRAVPGDLVITDSDQPFGIRADHDYCHDVWMLRKPLVAPHLAASGRPLWVTLRAGAGLAAILGSYLRALGSELNALSPAQLEAVADNIARLLAIICGAPRAEHRQAMQVALVDRAKQYIAGHLADASLGPATAATALGVSERTLHLAFEPMGARFTDEVTRQRLAECRAALASPIAADRSVSDIAYAWGFQSLATFYRAFRREYGIPPGEVRAAALRG
jgi:AraC-like DNA-binding protein